LLAKQGVFVSKLLRCLGFAISDKSDLNPKQVIKCLGFILDSSQMKVFIPPEKLEKFREDVSSALKSGRISLQLLSRIIGQMNSFSQAVLPGHLHCRNLERLLHEKLRLNGHSYKEVMSLSPEVVESFEWWLCFMEHFHGRAFQPPAPSIKITSDSSLVRWGAVCGEQTISYAWPVANTEHINIKELQAAVLAFQAFVPKSFSELTTVGLWLDSCDKQVRVRAV
jgi:hypothetical protein